MIKDFPKNIEWKPPTPGRSNNFFMPKLKIADISDPNNIIIFDKEFNSHGKAWSYLYYNGYVCISCKQSHQHNYVITNFCTTGSPCRLKYLIIDSINLSKCKNLKDYLIWQEFEYK